MNPILLPYTHDCFVCGADNPHGLQLRFRVEDGEVRAEFTPRSGQAGYKGIVHGGVIAAALDEAMFWAAAYRTRQFSVSVELNIRYARKVVVGRSYLLVARLERTEKRLAFTSGELRDLTTGQPCTTATGKYLPLPPAKVPLTAADFCADPATLPASEFFGPPSHPR